MQTTSNTELLTNAILKTLGEETGKTSRSVQYSEISEAMLEALYLPSLVDSSISERDADELFASIIEQAKRRHIALRTVITARAA